MKLLIDLKTCIAYVAEFDPFPAGFLKRKHYQNYNTGVSISQVSSSVLYSLYMKCVCLTSSVTLKHQNESLQVCQDHEKLKLKQKSDHLHVQNL